MTNDDVMIMVGRQMERDEILHWVDAEMDGAPTIREIKPLERFRVYLLSRRIKKPECCCHKPGMERESGTPCPFCPIHGEPMEPRKIEKVTTLPFGPRDQLAFEKHVYDKMNELIDAVNEMRESRP